MFSLQSLKRTSSLFTYPPLPLFSCSKRFKTVVVQGCTKNQGRARCPGKRRGPKKGSGEICKQNDTLVKQRHWTEPHKQWNAGFNVIKGERGFLNANCYGTVLYYFDTRTKKKYVHVVPKGEDPSKYNRPFYSAKEIYDLSLDRAIRRIKKDPKVSVIKKNKDLNELRNKQMNLFDRVSWQPVEIISEQYLDELNEIENKINELNDIKPLFEKEQILHKILSTKGHNLYDNKYDIEKLVKLNIEPDESENISENESENVSENVS